MVAATNGAAANGSVGNGAGTDGPRSLPFAVGPGQLPAGGDDLEHFEWREAWYPVQYLRDLDRDRPTPFVLLGRPIVLWWDRAAEVWRAFDDRCPHRLVPLSEGRITDDGLLECPYHGWAFAGDGQCDRIPQAPPDSDACHSPRSCATALPTTERQGLLFVYAGDPRRSDRVAVPTVPRLDEDPDSWVCLDISRDLPYDATTLLENVIDSSHLCFTHHNSVGKRSNAAPMNLSIAESDRQGFRGLWPEGPRKGTLGTQESFFVAPATLWHDLAMHKGGRTMTVVYATPTHRGACRTFARFPFQFPSKVPAFFMRSTPQWLAHLGQNGILEDDQVFLHHQERTLAEWGNFPNFARAFYLPTQADVFVFAFRDWTRRFQSDPFPGDPLPPAQDRRQLLDRYQSHTVHCRSCRTALRRIQTLRTGLAGSAIAALAAAPFLVALGASALGVGATGAIAIAAAAAWWRLGKLERGFIDGRTDPPRNRPEPKSSKAPPAIAAPHAAEPPLKPPAPTNPARAKIGTPQP